MFGRASQSAIQARGALDIVEAPDPALARRIERDADRPEVPADEMLRWPLGRAHGDVGVAPRQVRQLVPGMQLVSEERMVASQRLQRRRDKAVQDRVGRRDPHGPRDLVRLRVGAAHSETTADRPALPARKASARGRWRRSPSACARKAAGRASARSAATIERPSRRRPAVAPLPRRAFPHASSPAPPRAPWHRSPLARVQ